MGENNNKEKHVIETILWMIITALVVFIVMSFHYSRASLESGDIDYYASGTNASSGEFKKLKKVYDILNKNFLFEMDMEKIEEGAINGMIEALDDPYTNYFNKSQAENFLVETTTGEYNGIGIYITLDTSNNLAIVLMPIKNSPAEGAGIEPGDYIIAVDGKDVMGASTEEIASFIKGKVGTKVKIKFRRYDKDDKEVYTEFEKDIERRLVDLNPFESKIIEGNIGYITFEAFDDKTYPQFQKAYKEMEGKISGLIIDLRGNPGGLLNVATEVLDDLLPTGVITYTVDKNGNREYEYSDSNCTNIPVVVLVNENSASAAEISAAAIKDWDNGTVVGTTTFGKGLVQVLKRLGDGTYVKVTVSEYFSPNGNKINEIGVIPDIEVEDDEETTEDEQLQKAIEVIKEKMK